MPTNKPALTAPVVTLSRHRLTTDGDGVTTLVIFHGCPLRCRYCLNPYTTDDRTRITPLTPQALFDAVKCDALYFEATGGGVTFGGGEPLLQAAFLAQFAALCPSWRLTAETSLAVPACQVETAAEAIDFFIVDCKDTDPAVYKRYTGCDNTRMLENLRLLLSLVGPERIRVRVPLIPDYNTETSVIASEARLRAMGVTNVEHFSYVRR